MHSYSVHIITGDSPGVEPVHPARYHQARLVESWRRLGDTHGLAFCEGCEWSLRWPLRDRETLYRHARQHLGSAHFGDLLAGRACIDPDLCDGGEAHLRRRLEEATR